MTLNAAQESALPTVLEAAGNWLSELSEYIMPASVAANDGADYQPGYDKLEAALATFSPKGEEQRAETAEYADKRQSLAMFLLAMATGWTWDDAEGVDDYHANYLADADQVLRSMPHLLGLGTREQMGL